MVILEIIKRENLIQIYTKTHQIAPFQKISWGSMPPNPPSKAHGFAICKFRNLKKKLLAPLAKSWRRHCYVVATDIHVRPLSSTHTTKHPIQRSGN